MSKKSALVAGLFVLFVPYVNLAACAALCEFLQMTIIIYVLRKILENEYDFVFFCVLTILCLLRPEGFTFILFIGAKMIYLKKYKVLVQLLVPLIVVLAWMVRNDFVFKKFALVNPILSSRAMIGSIYGQIYVTSPNEFHQKYNYYNGYDYLKMKLFINDYQKIVRKELIGYIKENPIQFLLHRLKSVVYCFSYIGCNLERFPEENWRFSNSTNREKVRENNLKWGYRNLLANKDYVRLLIRGIYNGLIAILNFGGLIFLLIKFKKYINILFIFSTFCFLFIVEADTRYFITMQLLCSSIFIFELYEMFSNRKKRLAF